MLIPFSVGMETPQEINVPDECEIILHTVSTDTTASTVDIILRLSTKSTSNPITAAVLTSSCPTTSLQYKISPCDCPVVVYANGEGLLHIIASTSKQLNANDWIKPHIKSDQLAVPVIVENKVSQPSISSKKRRLKETIPLPSQSTVPPSLTDPIDLTMKPLHVKPSVLSSTSASSASLNKPWKVKASIHDGVIVPVPKQITKSSGVRYTDYIVGKQSAPKLGSLVKVIYQAFYGNGTLFDEHLTTTKPFQFRLGTGQVIRGLDIGVEGMRIGGAREITIPPELGYGDNGFGEMIPGNQVLVFRVTLLG